MSWTAPLENIGNFISDTLEREEEENLIMLFMESNENPLIHKNNRDFVVITAILAFFAIVLKMAVNGAKPGFFSMILIIALSGLAAYAGIEYFKAINIMAENHKIGGIALSVGIIAVLILII